MLYEVITDYNILSKIELLSELNSLINSQDIETIKDNVEEIKVVS